MKILIIQHENDFIGEQGVYFIEVIARCWREAGHKVVFINGLQKNITADVAILHVNLSVVPDEYVRYTMQFPVALNFGITDIRKRSISQYLVQKDDHYDGPVIVKTDLNCGGIPEAKIYNKPLPNRRSLMKYVRKTVRKTRRAGIKLNLINANARRLVQSEYRESFQTFENKRRVPTYIWENDDWIVEKFVPEKEGSKFVRRNAYFLGSKIIGFKSYSLDPIIKEEEEGVSDKIEVPEEIILLKNKLGLDYGKIDYVMYKEKPVVLDVAKTIGGGDFGRDTARILAPGIDDYFIHQNKLA
jgi:hypothetical protein